ncbi:response regulator [bacterium]|nr:response regulator [bacterium]
MLMPPPEQRLKLLLVAEGEANLQSLGQLLARDDVRIFTALSGNEALALMLEHDFALVLLDVQMPGMDGFEVARLMRAHERTRQVPVIFVTAISRDRRHVFSGYDAGAVDYLFKPLDPHVIRAKVAVFLELKRSQWARDHLLESLRCANAQLEAAAQAKSDSLAAASHELRTPLTAIKEFCALVNDGVVGPVTPSRNTAWRRRCATAGAWGASSSAWSTCPTSNPGACACGAAGSIWRRRCGRRPPGWRRAAARRGSGSSSPVPRPAPPPGSWPIPTSWRASWLTCWTTRSGSRRRARRSACACAAWPTASCSRSPTAVPASRCSTARGSCASTPRSTAATVPANRAWDWGWPSSRACWSFMTAAWIC